MLTMGGIGRIWETYVPKVVLSYIPKSQSHIRPHEITLTLLVWRNDQMFAELSLRPISKHILEGR
jgi:hypothetical protein